MDDAIGGCIVAIIVIGVAIWLFGIVIGLLVVTLPAWGSGAVSGTAVYGFARIKLASDLRSPSKFSQLVNFGFDGFKLNSEIKREAVKEYVAPYNIASVVLCLLVTAVVFMVLVSEPGMLGSEEEWIQVFGFFITAAITIGLAFLLWIRLDLTSAVEKEVKGALDQANISFQASGELQGIIRDNALIAQELQIDFPQGNVNSVRSYIDRHKAKVLTNPSSLRSVIAAEIEKAQRDRVNLRKAGERFDEVMQLHHKVSRTVFATGSPSMVNAIDEIYEQIHQAKQICLPQREWATFDEAMTVYTQDLKQLEEQALNLTAGEASDYNAVDPYEILGVTSDMTLDEIKKVYRELSNIYHPDKGKVRDDRRFKEIGNAWSLIKKQRKG
ncbi:MAG: J domain-containing protein [Desulfovermiculus sp.]